MKPEQTGSRTSSPCIEVTILWGASVLHVAHLSPPRAFHLGDAGACDCLVPADALGVPRAPLLLADERGAAQLVILPGTTGTVTLPDQAPCAVDQLADAAPHAAIEGARALPFPVGASARLELGGLVFAITSTPPAPAIAGLRRLRVRTAMFWAASAVAHACLMAACAKAPPGPVDDEDGLSADRVYQLQSALQEADEKAFEEKETEQIAENQADNREGGSGTRARGEEGSMGNPNTRATSSRYGVQGPQDSADPHLPRPAALRDAAEFGMIGLLNSGAGGDPSAPTAPWGRDDSFGAGGLGLSGVGVGGGGRGGAGEGIGLGSIGTLGHGAGVGNGQGFGAGAGRLGAGPHGAAPAAPAYTAPAYTAPTPTYAAPPPVQEVAIDANGRFATTYRPGGGHLAAFESAVARGIVPAADREIVSDVGARYTPTLEVAAGHALALRADVERGALAPSGGDVHVRLALRSSEKAAGARPHLSVHLVLDISGSMAGDSINEARVAAESLVDKLAPTDDFSLVTFSSDARVDVPDGPVGSRLEMIHQVIRSIHEEGGTNIGAGLQAGYAQASLRSIPEDAVRVVFLLSDGHANGGITNRDQLARLAEGAFQSGIQTSSFGLGADYDGALMSSIAEDGAGGYYYLRDAAQIAPALATELDRRLDPVATAVEVRVRLKGDVQLLHVYGSRRLDAAEAQRVRTAEVSADNLAARHDHIQQDRQDDAEGGMRFFMPAFARDDAHSLLLKLRVPAGVDARSIASVELKYKDRIGHGNVVEELPIKVSFAGSDAASAASLDPSVARTVQGFAAGEALADAAARIARNDRDGAADVLAEREAILRTAAETLREPLFNRDADRLARLRSTTGTTIGTGDPLVLAMLLETAGRSHLH